MNLESRFEIIEEEETLGITTDLNIWLKTRMSSTATNSFGDSGQDITEFCKSFIKNSNVKYFMTAPVAVFEGQQVTAAAKLFETTLDINELATKLTEVLNSVDILYTIIYEAPRFGYEYGDIVAKPIGVKFTPPTIKIRGKFKDGV